MNTTLDFRSDTVTRPTAAMRQAMATADVGDDVFGDDPTVNRLQQTAAQMLGHEAALFVPSGTQSNLIALLSHCGRGDEAIVGQTWHTYRWEAGGMAVLGSIQPQPIDVQPDGTLRLDDIEAAIKPDDAHFARTRLVALENTTGGRVLPPAYCDEVLALARRRGLATHLDGARLFNAAVALTQREGGSAADNARRLAAGFDTVSICLSKGLGAPVGSLLLGSHDTIARARRHRKILGGAMRQAGIVAAAGLHALQHHVERLANDHLSAAALAEGLGAIAAAAGTGLLRVDPPETNMVFVHVDASIAETFSSHLAEHGVQVVRMPARGDAGIVQRWVTHLDVPPAAVDAALAVARRYFSA